MKRIGLVLVFGLINFGALGIGGWLMGEGPTSDWYINLNKAPWTPPGWVFGVAWTTIMICFSMYLADLVIKSKSRLVGWLFGIQLVTNISWNFLFFNQHMMFLALVFLIILTAVVWIFFFKFKKSLGSSSYLLAPYMVWLLIACSLNAYALLYN